MGEIHIDSHIDPEELLNTFIRNCIEAGDLLGEEKFDHSIDMIALIYYYRIYSSSEEFIEDHEEALDADRKEWVIEAWKMLDGMSEEQMATSVIEMLSNVPTIEQ